MDYHTEINKALEKLDKNIERIVSYERKSDTIYKIMNNETASIPFLYILKPNDYQNVFYEIHEEYKFKTID
ncbi:MULTISPECIES: hypothetical protein [unclassified Tenacibaculum]|uniref:hypothetical protein n=1 Tax=unclassified Tenacibaculum TaxID=2635139 RepID=UPI001F4479C9|nr:MULTISPECIES: hypothetical protein [unclassified Tenacibaculum]MCF2875793.1 hypothetical protein [Tenacibaculum sp. Cn5-1]MCF2935868.1 hypothetical protein [Tenacibaculum sp. Cn5-34]MCG7512429.1 hypothetical protein [Tenacibaculum sp. Cn5-46]